MTQIQTYLNIARRGWWIILLTAVAAVVASLIYSSLSPRVYRTTARYIVSPQEIILSNQTDYFRSLDTLDRRSIITTYAEVFGSSRIFGEAAAALGEPADVLENYRVTAVSLPEANVIQVAVEGPDPNQVMAATLKEAAAGDAEALAWLRVCAPDKEIITHEAAIQR